MAENVRPFVIQNPYKNSSAPGNRLVSIDELKDTIFGIVKLPVRAATNKGDTSNWDYDEDAGTLTPDTDSPSVDGVELEDGDRILVTDRDDNPEQNGVYEYDKNKNEFKRAEDFDENEDFFDGAKVWVNEGTENGGTEWVLEDTGKEFELDETPVKFEQIETGSSSGSDVGPGDSGDGDDENNGTMLTGLYRQIGKLAHDGVKSEFVFEHKLYDAYPMVQVYNKTRNAYEICDISVKSVRSIEIRFFTPPAKEDEYWVIVHGNKQTT